MAEKHRSPKMWPSRIRLTSPYLLCSTLIAVAVTLLAPGADPAALASADSIGTAAQVTRAVAVADAYVSSSKPYTNYGSAPRLKVDLYPTLRTYLRFDVQGLNAAVTRATLRLYNYRGGAYAVRSVGVNSWSESGITYANAPQFATTSLASSGSVSSGSWTALDVTQAVTGNGSFSFAVVSSLGGSATILSRENGATYAPQLVVETASPVAAVAPVDSVPPAIQGTAQVGRTVSADTGTWSGTAPISYGYQWRRCGYVGAVAADRPLADWRLGEASGTRAADASGNGRDASYVGAVALGRAGARVTTPDSAAGLDGGSAAVVDSSFGSFPTAALSVELWLRTSDTSRDAGTFSYAVPGSDNELQLRDYRNFTVIRGGVRVTTGVSANDGAWHQIVLSWRASDGQTQLYKDGKLAYSGTLAAGSPIVGSGGAVVLGQDQDTVGGGFQSSQAFLGDLDEVSLYDRVLGAAEVAAHYAAADSSCAAIAGAGTASYSPAPADEGAALRVLVTADNAAGSASALSAAAGPVAGAATVDPPPPPPPPPPPASPPPPPPAPSPSPSPSGLLTWAPPANWQNYVTLNVGSGGQFNLDNSTDYKIVGASTSTRVRLNGGHNIVIMGSTIDVDSSYSSSEDNVGISISENGTTSPGRVVHIEGVRIGGAALGDAIKLKDPNAVVQLENVYVDLCHGSESTIHADVIQAEAGVQELRVDGLTGNTQYQGFMLKKDYGSGPAYNGPMRFRRTNIHDWNGMSQYLTWLSASSNSQLFLDGANGMWLGQAPGRDFLKSVWPDRDDSTLTSRPLPGLDTLGTYVTYPTFTNGQGQKIVRNWDNTGDGQLRQGVPSGGDFVLPGSVGVGYVSSGYQG